MDPIRLLNLSESSVIGGAEQVILQTSAALRAAGHDVTIASLARTEQSPSAYFRSAAESGVPTIGIPCRGRIDLKAAQRLAGVLADGRFDLLCTHGYKPDLVGRAAARRAGLPIVSYLHGWTGHTRLVRIYEAYSRRFLRHMDAVIAVSEPLRGTALAAGVSSDRVTVIPNAIRLDDFTPGDMGGEVRREFGIPDGAPIIGSIGRLSDEKGQRFLLQALSIVREARENAVALLVGDGPDRASLEQQARQAGLAASVVFTGFRQDVRRLLCAFDVFALPSLTEGTPVSLLEAMACVRPCVATAVGGVPQVIRDAGVGWLVPSKNPAALAGAILSVLSDAGEARRRAEAGAVWVRERYSLDRQVSDLADVYRGVLERSGRPAIRSPRKG